MSTLKLTTVIAVCALLHQPAKAFDLNDCIINGMKGISSDLAARQVRYACDQKHQAHKADQLSKLEAEFGKAVSDSSVALGEHTEGAGANWQSITITSREATNVLTLVRLEVSPAIGGSSAICDPSKTKVYAYRALVKPGSQAKLFFPALAEASCISVLSANARPGTWRDFSFSSSFQPMASDPFALVR